MSSSKGLTVEKVTHILSPTNPTEFLPRISSKKQSAAANPFDNDEEEELEDEMLRELKTEDFNRILDFHNVPEPPTDCPMLHCEYDSNNDPTFPRRHVALRGGYLFYFDLSSIKMQKEDIYTAPPLGVIPLEQTVVEFPPGGRRVFREHAHTDARHGYEMVIKKRGKEEEEEEEEDFPPAFLAAESLGQRDNWAAALRVRAEVWKKDTMLRPSGGGGGGGRGADVKKEVGSSAIPGSGGASVGRRSSKRPSVLRPPSSSVTGLSSDLGLGGGEDSENVDAALQQFGITGFKEEDWLNEYFEQHSEFDAPGMCEKLEQWQNSIKMGLRGAVLEQYEYFVEGSKEMTTMGREVASLRGLVDQQRESIETMKNIDFAAAFADPVTENYGYSSEEDNDEDSVSSSESSDSSTSGRGGGAPPSVSRRPSRRGSDKFKDTDENSAPEDEKEVSTLIEIPPWLSDCTEEISAFIKECRYTDATDLLLKAKAEVTDILNQHEKLTDRKLNKKQLSSMNRILQGIDNLTERMGNRLAEGLRRKNEALKQAAKRERADPLSVLAPLVSPICLNDDAIALSLLVKLGKPQDAATAYAARRSLLLMESLHERPISSAGTSGTMDVVIYAAQLSQSFFSCLAMAVEGFLDLFLEGGGSNGANLSSSRIDDDDQTSLNSNPSKKVPAGALAAIVLWCDSELLKFSAAFGGTRVLGNLQLAPPSRGGGAINSPTASKKQQQQESIADQRNRLRQAEEMGEFAAAAALRQKLAEREQEERKNRSKGGAGSIMASGENKDRQAAVEIAAKCVDQAFQFASENLDSIGLPLTPRLAYYIRSRLKGCEAEIATLLEGRWDHITFDWVNSNEMEGMGDRRQRIGDIRSSSAVQGDGV